jgi:asparagine synthase (glutamine-hydrolysing)
MHGRIGKYIFKQAVAPWVPQEVAARRKMGFSAPLAEWLRTELRPLFEGLALDPGMGRYLWLPHVKRIWDEHQSGLRNHDQRLWNVLMLAAWAARRGSGSSSEILATAAAE